MESDAKPLMKESSRSRAYSSVRWALGPVIYTAGLLLALATGNLARFLIDYPWACLIAVIALAAWAIPLLSERHRRYTIAIRRILNTKDDEFAAMLENNMRRLTGARNLVYGLVFLPALLWAFTQRLWWQEYSQPALFDGYYLVILAFILPYYAGTMFGAAVSCNQNMYTIFEKTPINREYLLDEGQPILRRLWGGQILRVTALALIMSALANVPVLLYSGSTSLLMNLAIALALTTLIFVVPHYMFHRALERAKEDTLTEVSHRKRALQSSVQTTERNTQSAEDVGRMLDLIYLTQYGGVLRNRSTWLVDLEVVVELLVVGFLHVTFMEILSILAHH